MPASRCRYCGRLFRPDPRTARFQKSCGREACRLARQRQKLRRWRALHPDHAKRYQPKVRAWAKAFPNYWRHYRKGHPKYVRRDNCRRCTAMKGSRCSANETAMTRVVVEKLRALESLGPRIYSANETTIARRVDAMEECLRSTVAIVCSAKQTDMAHRAAVAG